MALSVSVGCVSCWLGSEAGFLSDTRETSLGSRSPSPLIVVFVMALSVSVGSVSCWLDNEAAFSFDTQEASLGKGLVFQSDYFFAPAARSFLTTSK